MSYFDQKAVNQVIPEQEPRGEPIQGIPQFVRTKETGDKAYFVQNGEYHWITTPQVLEALGGNFDVIQMIERKDFATLGHGDKITMENVDQYKIEQSELLEKVSLPGEEELEFKQYEEEPGIPHETIKGLTSIIMPVWFNSYPAFHYTGNAIGSIREHTDKLKTPYELIVVLQGDTGIKLSKLEDTKADKVIELKNNEGYSRAVNKGIRVAQGEYIAILNNDIMVFDHWLEDMQDALNHLDLVMATPMYGEPFARAVEADFKRLQTIPNPTTRDTRLDPGIENTFSDFKDFSCVLTKKEVFDKIGLFDEQFFMYGEDLDFMRRMEKEGMKVASTKRVNTHHIISGTSSGNEDTPRIMDESKAKLKQKWGY